MVDLEARRTLDTKMSLDEYLYEMNHKSELLKYPSKTDWNDPLYCKKFAHCMPPLIAYRCRPANLDKQNV